MSESEGMPERVAVSDDGGGYLTADREVDDVEGEREAVYVRADIHDEARLRNITGLHWGRDLAARLDTALRERDEARAEAERLREALRECVEWVEGLAVEAVDGDEEHYLHKDAMEVARRAHALLAP